MVIGNMFLRPVGSKPAELERLRSTVIGRSDLSASEFLDERKGIIFPFHAQDVKIDSLPLADFLFPMVMW